MKIGLIRHFEVDQPFLKGMVSQSEVLQWFKAYDTAPVIHSELEMEEDWDICYSSTLPRARETALKIVDKEIVFTDLLREPFPDPVFKRELKLPFLLWGLIIRSAILGNHSSQQEGRNQMIRRLQEFLESIQEHRDRSVLIVSHSFTLRLLSELLLREGFQGSRLRSPKNGVLYTFKKE